MPLSLFIKVLGFNLIRGTLIRGSLTRGSLGSFGRNRGNRILGIRGMRILRIRGIRILRIRGMRILRILILGGRNLPH